MSKAPVKPTNVSNIPSKIEFLMRLLQLQMDLSSLFERARYSKNGGDFSSASEEYDSIIVKSKEKLQVELLHNQYYRDPIDIHPTVQSLLNMMFIQADILESMKDLQKAERLRKEAIELSQRHLSRSGSADAERTRAVSLISHGLFNEAVVALEACRNLFQQEHDYINVAKTTIDVVDIRSWLGDYETCLSDLKHVDELLKGILQGRSVTQQDIISSMIHETNKIMAGEGSGKGLVDTVDLWDLSKKINFYKGLVNEHLGNVEDAEIFFKKILPDFQKSGVGPGIESHLVTLLIKRGKYEEALAYAKRLEPAVKANSSLRPKLAVILKTQGEALLKLGRADEALNILRRAIEDLHGYHDPELLWKLQWRIGQALDWTGQRDKALEAYSQAAEIVNNLRKAPLGYRLDSTYLKDKLELFTTAIGLACNSGCAENCCKFMEMIKSRTLTATLSIHPGDPSNDLERKADELTRKLDVLEYNGYREGWTKELHNKRNSLLDERTDILERIRISDPRWRAMSEPIPFDLHKLTKVLFEHGQAVLNLFYIADQNKYDRIVAVIIKDNKTSVAAVTISSDIKSKLENYQLNLQASKPNPKLFDLSINAEEIIPPELLSLALQARQLIIVPHGILHLIPWGSLRYKGKRLFEYSPIGVLPNVSCIHNLITSYFSSNPRIALIGPPDYKELPYLGKQLLGALREVKNIQEMYSGRSSLIGKPLIGPEATEENFWELINHRNSSEGILHVACHGALESDDPMNSGLLLADSKVDASEIARSSMRFNEVILSACSSGWRPMKFKGVELSGDDIIGLAGAFLEAGVKSVLVSITPAYDLVVPKFMGLYHKNRLEGKRPLVALQETQKAMLYTSIYPPYFWTGFTIYGCQ